MPGRTGIETLETIRKITQDAVVVLRTAYGTAEEAIEAMKLEAYDFIIKTVDLQLVKQAVSRALEHALRHQVEHNHDEDFSWSLPGLIISDERKRKRNDRREGIYWS